MLTRHDAWRWILGEIWGGEDVCDVWNICVVSALCTASNHCECAAGAAIGARSAAIGGRRLEQGWREHRAPTATGHTHRTPQKNTVEHKTAFSQNIAVSVVYRSLGFSQWHTQRHTRSGAVQTHAHTNRQFTAPPSQLHQPRGEDPPPSVVWLAALACGGGRGAGGGSRKEEIKS